jgi:hypothetical protein
LESAESWFPPISGSKKVSAAQGKFRPVTRFVPSIQLDVNTFSLPNKIGHQPKSRLLSSSARIELGSGSDINNRARADDLCHNPDRS